MCPAPSGPAASHPRVAGGAFHAADHPQRRSPGRCVRSTPPGGGQRTHPRPACAIDAVRRPATPTRPDPACIRPRTGVPIAHAGRAPTPLGGHPSPCVSDRRRQAAGATHTWPDPGWAGPPPRAPIAHGRSCARPAEPAHAPVVGPRRPSDEGTTRQPRIAPTRDRWSGSSSLTHPTPLTAGRCVRSTPPGGGQPTHPQRRCAIDAAQGPATPTNADPACGRPPPEAPIAHAVRVPDPPRPPRTAAGRRRSVSKTRSHELARGENRRSGSPVTSPRTRRAERGPTNIAGHEPEDPTSGARTNEQREDQRHNPVNRSFSRSSWTGTSLRTRTKDSVP